MMKQGKKSPMTNEKALKLSELGMVWDAQKKRGQSAHLVSVPAAASAVAAAAAAAANEPLTAEAAAAAVNAPLPDSTYDDEEFPAGMANV
jgi:hypothetical protein